MRRGIRRFKRGSVPISADLDDRGKAFVAGALRGAYADFDWMTVGRKDPVERVAKVFMEVIDETMEELADLDDAQESEGG